MMVICYQTESKVSNLTHPIQSVHNKCSNFTWCSRILTLPSRETSLTALQEDKMNSKSCTRPATNSNRRIILNILSNSPRTSHIRDRITKSNNRISLLKSIKTLLCTNTIWIRCRLISSITVPPWMTLRSSCTLLLRRLWQHSTLLDSHPISTKLSSIIQTMRHRWMWATWQVMNVWWGRIPTSSTSTKNFPPASPRGRLGGPSRTQTSLKRWTTTTSLGSIRSIIGQGAGTREVPAVTSWLKPLSIHTKWQLDSLKCKHRTRWTQAS